MDHVRNEHPDTSPIEVPQGLVQRASPLLLIAATIVAIDQGTKALIRNWLAEGEYWPTNAELLRISHYENSGAAFGVLQGAGPLLIVTTVIAIIVISFTIFRGNDYPRWFTLALALVLGGAIGNLVDRLTRGSVTDFIDPTHYPAFNIADSAIVVGVTTLVILTFLDRDEPNPAVVPTEASIESSTE
ncbi:MAG: signal peptidase II [Dehalococcoidia bacterium]|jgi:signal peptidase II|nr:signal peptidase II [Dehalococcoidia bacterium]